MERALWLIVSRWWRNRVIDLHKQLINGLTFLWLALQTQRQRHWEEKANTPPPPPPNLCWTGSRLSISFLFSLFHSDLLHFCCVMSCFIESIFCLSSLSCCPLASPRSASLLVVFPVLCCLASASKWWNEAKRREEDILRHRDEKHKTYEAVRHLSEEEKWERVLRSLVCFFSISSLLFLLLCLSFPLPFLSHVSILPWQNGWLNRWHGCVFVSSPPPPLRFFHPAVSTLSALIQSQSHYLSMFWPPNVCVCILVWHCIVFFSTDTQNWGQAESNSLDKKRSLFCFISTHRPLLKHHRGRETLGLKMLPSILSMSNSKYLPQKAADVQMALPLPELATVLGPGKNVSPTHTLVRQR